MTSPVDDLAEVLAGMARARELAATRATRRLLAGPRRIYPMGVVASQLTVNPFEFFMLLALVITSISYAFVGVAAPSSVTLLLPEAWVRVWIINLALGSMCALIGGLWRRDADKGLLVYQFGWGLAGIATTIYGTAVLLRVPVAGLYPGLTNVLFGIACITRVLQVQRFFRIADLLRLGLLRLPFFEAVPPADPPAEPPAGGEQHDRDLGSRE